MKKFFLVLIFSIFAYADFSLLSLSVPPSLAMYNAYVSLRSNQFVAKLQTMKSTVIQDIEDEIKAKQYNINRLKELSQVDYLSNKEYIFLLQKLNKISNLSIDNINTSTTLKKQGVKK